MGRWITEKDRWVQLSCRIFHTWICAAFNSFWAYAQITQTALGLASIFLGLVFSFNTNLALASKQENWCLLITAQIDSQTGQRRLIRCSVLSNWTTRDINDTAKLPKVCPQLSLTAELRRHVLRKHKHRAKLLAAATILFQSLIPHGGKTNVLCTAKPGVFGACPSACLL